ncbi:uncharacterized protein LOC131887745 isoform X2 [Tigriopus californicus]|uniref:uncharacterized protein LOC131887745 isoform X2 n=1 Tax=Tigriopus californicus TaxID=6832 RepID=UPI0027D9D542|nr:uncharacterized protein LOC131887745 isoform X2 [Tigriopus californicus]
MKSLLRSWVPNFEVIYHTTGFHWGVVLWGELQCCQAVTRTFPRSCQRALDCLSLYELCVNNQCMNLGESTGIQGWIVASTLIGLVLTLCTVMGCICLHPDCAWSKRFAHPRDKRLITHLEQGLQKSQSESEAETRRQKYRSMSNTSRVTPSTIANKNDEMTRF